jgi:hypothetical protein
MPRGEGLPVTRRDNVGDREGRRGVCVGLGLPPPRTDASSSSVPVPSEHVGHVPGHGRLVVRRGAQQLPEAVPEGGQRVRVLVQDGEGGSGASKGWRTTAVSAFVIFR